LNEKQGDIARHHSGTDAQKKKAPPRFRSGAKATDRQGQGLTIMQASAMSRNR